MAAGIADRSADPSRFMDRLRAPAGAVEGEQVHGASIAVVGRGAQGIQAVAGCDALLTNAVGLALRVRTADCLPIFFAAPLQGAVGLAHAGWRGVALALPARVVAAFRRTYHSRPETLQVAIGPAIRVCCYEVGPEFDGRFGRFVQECGGRRMCDLIGAAIEQLRASGVRPDRIVDTRQCTACEAQRWFSLRRQGPATGRLTSFIVVRP